MNDKAKVTVNIDGRDVQVDAGIPVIEACKQAGRDIPHFCYHQDLSIAGNCRMCAVEIEKARGLPISCATPVADGMIVRTDTERVKAHRKAVMEFLLINHPIDCPICDQAGECALQIYYMQHDLQPSRLDVEKVHYEKRLPIGPEVMLDRERCVECTRCIRFCEEVPGTSELCMTNRGDRSIIATFPDTPLENDYSVCTADVCPVGALTQRDFRFKVRPWFLKEAESICTACARGCNVYTDYGWHPVVRDYEGKAYRTRPRRNPHVNKSWMCDFGRGEYRKVNEDRVLEARLGGETATVEKTLEAALRVLREAGQPLLIGSLDSSLEELHVLQRLAQETFRGAPLMAVPHRPDGKEDDILLRADKHPNRKGAEWMGVLGDRGRLTDLLKGRRAVLIHQADLLLMDEDGALEAALREVPHVVMIAANHHRTTALATHLLPGRSLIEKDGHFVNFEGRLQRFFRGRYMKSPGAARDDVALLAKLSGDVLPATARAAFQSLASRLSVLEGLDWTSAGREGLLPGAVSEGVEV